ncbi:hypothetical protein [Serratia sp. (in: enterobacteria)]|uniref:hypothetical protein n=1 Tax=Serratia sp. (in: enterobacteria) TaxID=616 RepID=UPI003988C941
MKKGIGIYCTVCSNELAISLATLGEASRSSSVSKIIILLTDSLFESTYQLSNKITLCMRNFGKGYDTSIEEGGYDQVSARNYTLDFLDTEDIDWVMMHDADDIYDPDFYDFILETHSYNDAVTCSCFTFRDINTLCVPQRKELAFNGSIFHDPHTRIWKKSLNLRYEKSKGVEGYFVNHSRHCGVVFPETTMFGFTDRPWHFHLHALLNKRHSKKIFEYPIVNIEPPVSVKEFLERNLQAFNLSQIRT